MEKYMKLYCNGFKYALTNYCMLKLKKTLLKKTINF